MIVGAIYCTKGLFCFKVDCKDGKLRIAGREADDISRWQESRVIAEAANICGNGCGSLVPRESE